MHWIQTCIEKSKSNHFYTKKFQYLSEFKSFDFKSRWIKSSIDIQLWFGSGVCPLIMILTQWAIGIVNELE